MSNISFVPGTAALATSTDQLTIVVDLGFAKHAKSCGMAWGSFGGKAECRSLSFSDCVEKVASLLKEQDKANLVLEAPLSGFFDAAGNPTGRTSFEKKGSQTRYWYTGPGATTCLAAIHFLRALVERCKGTDADTKLTVYLYEGFLSFKSDSADNSKGHEQDALGLWNAFVAKRVANIKPSEGESALGTLQILGLCELDDVPAVVTPNEFDRFRAILHSYSIAVTRIEAIEQEYRRLCATLNMPPVELVLYQVADDKVIDLKANSFSLACPRFGVDGSFIGLHVSPAPTPSQLSWPPDFHASLARMGETEQWPQWRVSLWHEVVHQFAMEMGCFDASEAATDANPGAGHGVGWEQALARVASALNVGTEVLRKRI